MTKRLLTIALLALVPLGLFAVSELDAQSSWRMPVKSGLTTGSLIYASSRSNLGAISAVTTGQVLASAGASTAPAFTASPSLTGSVSLGDANADAHASLGSWTGLRGLAVVHTTGNLTLTNAHCGRTIVNNATTGAQTFTLPAVADVPGCEITLLAGHADGEILVNMAASGTCVITTFGAVGADADTAIVTDASCDTGLKNTAATNAIGDSLKLVSDGTRWLGVGITTGIWASQ